MTTKAKIFLAEDRGLNVTPWFRSENMFNFGQYQQVHKQPFGNLYVLNDDTLDGGHSLDMLAEQDSFIVLLPVIGAVAFHISSGQSGLLAAGQAQFLQLAKGDRLHISNPFATEPVNFLQVWIRHHQQAGPALALENFDVNVFQNCLVKISPQRLGETLLPFSVSIGKFSGRGETVHRPSSPDAGLFVMVLDGAFEVEGRLLHPRDGLALYETEQVEMEALSQAAIILLVEQPFLPV